MLPITQCPIRVQDIYISPILWYYNSTNDNIPYWILHQWTQNSSDRVRSADCAQTYIRKCERHFWIVWPIRSYPGWIRSWATPRPSWVGKLPTHVATVHGGISGAVIGKLSGVSLQGNKTKD